MRATANDNIRPERRSERRRKVLMSGKIAWRDNMLSGDCTIRDLSDGGAKVRLADPLAPNDPVLIVLRTGQAFAARTAWRHGALAGLAFEESYDLTQPGPEPMPYTRRLWLDQLPR
ncbi:PilZ domain-containing protein [Phenylobacterium sp.]|uniref:PilZ domain-containing protein n=1 Tax=Phenylobacterium sp. TaxID=1871053 RepID=UPI0035B05487